MTTVIYFFLMSVIYFIVPQLIVKAFDREVKIGTNIIYLVFAACLPLIWIFLPKEILSIREVNFLQHAVGGGVACGFVAIYLIKNLKHIFPILNRFLAQVLFVYALVSMLGIANEMLEFLLDTLKIGIFSSDRYDTWYDLLANTSGAMIIYLIYYTIIGFRE